MGVQRKVRRKQIHQILLIFGSGGSWAKGVLQRACSTLSRFLFQELQLPLECMQSFSIQNTTQQQVPRVLLLSEEPLSFACFEAGLHFEAGFTCCP